MYLTDILLAAMALIRQGHTTHSAVVHAVMLRTQDVMGDAKARELLFDLRVKGRALVKEGETSANSWMKTNYMVNTKTLEIESAPQTQKETTADEK